MIFMCKNTYKIIQTEWLVENYFFVWEQENCIPFAVPEQEFLKFLEDYKFIGFL